MSATVLVYFERSGHARYPGNEESDPGTVIPRVAAGLEALARDLGVLPLGAFHWADPELLRATMEDLEGPPRERLARLLAEQREWHDVEDGRRSVAALLAHLETADSTRHPKLLLGGTLEPLLFDLRALAAVLAATTERFHLEAL